MHGVIDYALKKKLCIEPNLSYERAKEVFQTPDGAEGSLENFQQAVKGQVQGGINFVNKKNKLSNK